MRITVIDFPSSTYHDSGGEIYQLTHCIRNDSGAYVAGPVSGNGRVSALQRWLLPEQGWFVGCTSFHSVADKLPWDWYVDLAAIDVTPDQWCVTDHYIDVTVYEGERYEILDLDEFVDGIEAGHLPVDKGLRTVRSVHQICSELKDAGFSMKTLLAQHVPSLPGVQPWMSL